MAVRSGAGTGVIVSLVVFVLTTVFLLVLTIVFYAGKTKEIETRVSAEQALAAFIKPNERNIDSFKELESDASRRGQSVTRRLWEQLNELKRFVAGNESLTNEALRSEMGTRFNVPENGTVANRLSDLTREVRNNETEIDSLNEQQLSLTNQLAEKDAQLEAQREAHQQELDNLRAEFEGYRVAAEQYRQQLTAAIEDFEQTKERLRNRYEGQIRDLQATNDDLSQERVLLRTTIEELRNKIAQDQLRLENPALLVDGDILDVLSNENQVFISRGRQDRIVRGMQFEVYEDHTRVLNANQQQIRGKATIQVVTVGETTSRCRILREVASRPIVRGDVIVNAVYDPNYRYKFLVHGLFDLDLDGRATEADAEQVRSLIVDWGGTVVYGEQLPGDLDFLVLGIEPIMPPDPAPGASEAVLRDWSRKRAAYDTYQRVYKQAIDAQIPVLNTNRFLILIGHYN